MTLTKRRKRRKRCWQCHGRGIMQKDVHGFTGLGTCDICNGEGFYLPKKKSKHINIFK